MMKKLRARLAANGKVILKALSIYVAAAWGLLQVVEFAVANYGLNRLLLDSAVIIAFGGGMITAVLAWCHGAAGSQSATRSELSIIGTIAVLTVAGVLFLAQNDPLKKFERQEGFRLVFDLQDSLEEAGLHGTAGAGPPEGWYWTESAAVHMNPDYGIINYPDLHVKWEGYPMRIQHTEDTEYQTITIVLPSEPRDISDLLSVGSKHRSAVINSTNIEISFRTPFEAKRSDSGVTFRTHISGDAEEVP